MTPPSFRAVLATANPDKAAEIRPILESALGDNLLLVARPAEIPDVEETGTTLEENARIKAERLSAATHLPAIADDTGLEVEGLEGAPGVYSARYAGESATYADNVARLIRELSGIAEADPRRRARFRTVAICRFPDGREVVAEGCVFGRIAAVPKGESGFGYDPVFVPEPGDGRTFAEMTPEEKHAMSHRGEAFRSLAEGLIRLAASVS